MTTATAGATPCKKRINILPSNIATLQMFLKHAYRSKNLPGLTCTDGDQFQKESTNN